MQIQNFEYLEEIEFRGENDSKVKFSEKDKGIKDDEDFDDLITNPAMKMEIVLAQ